MGQYERAIDDLDRGDPARREECGGVFQSRAGPLRDRRLRPGDRRPQPGDRARAEERRHPLQPRPRSSSGWGCASGRCEITPAAVRLEPRLAPAYAAIGRIQSQLGHRDEAMRDFDMALRLDPKGMGVGGLPGPGQRPPRGGRLGRCAVRLRPRHRAPAQAGRPLRGAGLGAARFRGRVGRQRRPRLSRRSRAGTTASARTWPCWRSSAPAARRARPRRAGCSTRPWSTRPGGPGRSRSCTTSAATSTRPPCSAPPRVSGSRPRSTPSSGSTGSRPATAPRPCRTSSIARDHGSPGSIAADVARAAIGRIESGG